MAFIRFTYQFQQRRRGQDFDTEFPRRPEVPFVERYHKVAPAGYCGVQHQVVARVG
jgi:hypothetical protein